MIVMCTAMDNVLRVTCCSQLHRHWVVRKCPSDYHGFLGSSDARHSSAAIAF